MLDGRCVTDVAPTHGHFHARHLTAAQRLRHRICGPRRSQTQIAVRVIERVEAGLLDHFRNLHSARKRAGVVTVLNNLNFVIHVLPANPP